MAVARYSSKDSVRGARQRHAMDMQLHITTVDCAAPSALEIRVRCDFITDIKSSFRADSVDI